MAAAASARPRLTRSARSIRFYSFTIMAQTLVSTLPVNHEDLSDELVLLNPDEMAFTSMVKKGSAPENVEFSTPADIRLSGSLGGVKDHETVDRTNITNQHINRERLRGTIQHFRETHGESIVAQSVMDPAGISDLFLDGRMKAMTRMKEDMELTFLSQQDCQMGSTTLEFLTRGASMAIDAAAQPNSSYAVASAYRPVAGQNLDVAAVTTVTEANIRALLQACRLAKKGPVKLTGFCTLDMATRFDDYFTEASTSGSVTPVRRFNTNGATGTYEIGITRYKTRFGYVDIVPTTYLNGVRNSGSLAGASTTNTDATVTVTSTAGLRPFMRVYGSGIPAGAYIASITNATTFELSAAATATATPTLTLGQFDHALFLDMEFFEMKTSLVPSGPELPEDGGGKDGFVQAIAALHCTYPGVHGKIADITP
jgi:hypothetical protein